MASRAASARRYAEAVFEVASETGSFETWERDLRTIADFALDADVRPLLASGKVPRDEKMRLLRAALEGKVGPLAWNLVQLLEQRGKVDLAREIQTIFQERVDEYRGVAHAVVTTAVSLDEAERAAIAQRLSAITGKQIDVTSVVDPAIIGGVVARIGDELIDGSTRSKLVALKRRLESAVR